MAKTKKTAVKSTKAVKAKKASKEEITVDRRAPSERREADERRVTDEPISEERRRDQERRKTPRRRQIDPTTCERDYSDSEIEFMQAMDDYKRANGRMFPTCSEILEVLQKLGYEKVNPATELTHDASRLESDTTPATDIDATDIDALELESVELESEQSPANEEI